MSDTDETKRPKTLSLKKTETSTVKQSFSHGRTKAVVVEKKRTLGAPGACEGGGQAGGARRKARGRGSAEAAKPAAKAQPPRARRGAAPAFRRGKSPPRHSHCRRPRLRRRGPPPVPTKTRAGGRSKKKS